MNAQNHPFSIYHLIVGVLIGLLVAGCGQAGIDSPITINGLPLQVVSVKLQDTYEWSQKTIQPKSYPDTLMIIDAKIPNFPGKEVSIPISVTDDKGRTEQPVLTQEISDKDQDGKITAHKIRWVVVVSEAGKSFTLNLPENKTVKLDSFLK